MNPLISIVLPTYNGARFIAQSIQSCVDQTYLNWELIVVDDASIDDTPRLLADFAARDSRIQVIRHEKNKKLPGALNTGFAQARGDYLTWTSDDNLYRPEALEEMAAVLAGNPTIDVIYADYSVIDETDQIEDIVKVNHPRSLVYKSCVGPCFLYRRAVHEIVGKYAEDLFLAEDYDFWLRVSARFTLQPLHQDLYLYRRHDGSLTDQYRPQVMAAREQTLRQNLPTLHWATHTDLAEGYLHLRELAKRQHAPSRVIRYWLRALRYHPLLVLRRGLKNLSGTIFGERFAARGSALYRVLKKR